MNAAEGSRGRGFRVRHACPQCGGPVDLEETDRLFTCGFCRVRLFIDPGDHFRYRLPAREDAEFDRIYYVPYWRFLGAAYRCERWEVRGRRVDTSFRGRDEDFLPPSLGYRQQTQVLRFAEADGERRFLPPAVAASEVLGMAGEQAAMAAALGGAGSAFHRAFVGDAVSLVYMPIGVRRRALYDALTVRPLAGFTLPRQALFEEEAREDPGGRVRFHPALCPDCGWDLEGGRDSVVLWCTNCDTAWEAGGSGYRRVGHGAAGSPGRADLWMPFWRLDVTIEGLAAGNLAEFVRAVNLPLVPPPEWEARPVRLWAPAFRVAPRQFLRLSRQLTLLQFEAAEGREARRRARQPVTLSSSDLADGLKVLLSAAAVARRRVFPELSRISVTLDRATLVEVPFLDRGRELVQPEAGFSLQPASLRSGR